MKRKVKSKASEQRVQEIVDSFVGPWEREDFPLNYYCDGCKAVHPPGMRWIRRGLREESSYAFVLRCEVSYLLLTEEQKKKEGIPT